MNSDLTIRKAHKIASKYCDAISLILFTTVFCTSTVLARNHLMKEIEGLSEVDVDLELEDEDEGKVNDCIYHVFVFIL
jgi:hypothetical protein